MVYSDGPASAALPCRPAPTGEAFAPEPIPPAPPNTGGGRTDDTIGDAPPGGGNAVFGGGAIGAIGATGGEALGGVPALNANGNGADDGAGMA